MDDIFAEVIKWILAATLASIPGIIALLSQKSKQSSEKPRTDKETKKIETEIAEKVQEIYQEMVSDIKEQSSLCKSKIEELVITVDQLRKENNYLMENNNKLVLLVEKQGVEIKKLKDTINILVSQLKAMNIKPDVELDDKS